MPKRLGELSARHVIFIIGIAKEGKIIVGHARLGRLQRRGLKSGENSRVSESERSERTMKRRKTTFKDGVIEYSCSLLVCFSFSFFLTFFPLLILMLSFFFLKKYLFPIHKTPEKLIVPF